MSDVDAEQDTSTALDAATKDWITRQREFIAGRAAKDNEGHGGNERKSGGKRASELGGPTFNQELVLAQMTLAEKVEVLKGELGQAGTVTMNEAVDSAAEQPGLDDSSIADLKLNGTADRCLKDLRWLDNTNSNAVDEVVDVVVPSAGEVW